MKKIKSSDAPLVIAKVAENSPIGRQIVWDFILKHWSTLETRWANPSFVTLLNCSSKRDITAIYQSLNVTNNPS